MNLVVPIGVIVAVAIVCVVLAVLTSAQRADEVSFNREQQLIQQAITNNGERVLRAARKRRREPRGPRWRSARLRPAMGAAARRRLAADLLQARCRGDRRRFRSNQISRASRRTRGDDPPMCARILRRSSICCAGGQRAAKPRACGHAHAESVASRAAPPRLIQRFQNRPAIVAAVAVGTDADLGSGNARRADRRLRQIHRRSDAARDRQRPANLGSARAQRPRRNRPRPESPNSPTCRATRSRVLPGSRPRPGARS